MIVLKKGGYNYHATCLTCHTEAIMNLPISHICPNCGDLMVVSELQKPLKMAFVEAYDHEKNQKEGVEEMTNEQKAKKIVDNIFSTGLNTYRTFYEMAYNSAMAMAKWKDKHQMGE